MKAFSISVSKNNPQNLCQTHVDSFLSYLRTLGYAERTLRKKRPVAASFARWTVGKQLTLNDLNESHLSAFLERFPRRQNARVKFEMAVLRLFFQYLRDEAVVPSLPMVIDASPADDLKRTYIDYLRKERGLAENSILVYLPFISDFLNDRLAQTGCISFHALDALTIQNFLLDRIRNRSSQYSRLLAAALRSFLRFLYLREKTTIDMSRSVPGVRKWHQPEVIGFLTPDEVEQILSSTSLSTPRGRRDHAILVLLARLGLRAGEVITLELGDILWRTGEIVVRGKGRVQDRLPLLSDVGEALAAYLCQDRGDSVSRRVFLRINAPRVGMAGPGAIGHIVRRTLARAGICAPSRGAAHLFRHSLATRMIRQGASIPEISEILRHRSQSSTAVYAKVDFETLREVAPSWPDQGGVR
jgi:integrase/recombinase XerD